MNKLWIKLANYKEEEKDKNRIFMNWLEFVVDYCVCCFDFF